LLGRACGWNAQSERIPRDVCRGGDAQTERRLKPEEVVHIQMLVVEVHTQMLVAVVRTAFVGAVGERG
jgi:hypothetical protein